MLIASASLLSHGFYEHVVLGTDRGAAMAAGIAAIALAVFVPTARLQGHYDADKRWLLRAEIGAVLALWILSVLFLIAVGFALKIGNDFSRGSTFLFAGSGAMALCGHRLLRRQWAEAARRKGQVRAQSVALIGTEERLADGRIREAMAEAGLRVRTQGTLRGASLPGTDPAAALRDVLSAIWETDAEEIFVAASLEEWLSLRDALRAQPLPVYLIPDDKLSQVIGCRRRAVHGGHVVEVQRGPLSEEEQRLKRWFDITVAALALFLLGPLLLVVALAVKLDTPGEVLFRQTRRGFNGKLFQIYKFRSMHVQENGEVIRQASRHDSRVTRVGWWLRRSSIDELPQLLNVLRGEMSLVGPRPHALAHDNHYAKLIENYAFRHHVKPGITGWAQANGHRGETPSIEAMKRRVEHDVWYVDHAGLLLDLKIIVMTVLSIVVAKNAF
ncbi:exopolysaccharide biosynthesis polyprenyl glycosylphosphotransferase [Methylobacterium sp. JK268]